MGGRPLPRQLLMERGASNPTSWHLCGAQRQTLLWASVSRLSCPVCDQLRQREMNLKPISSSISLQNRASCACSLPSSVLPASSKKYLGQNNFCVLWKSNLNGLLRLSGGDQICFLYFYKKVVVFYFVFWGLLQSDGLRRTIL